MRQVLFVPIIGSGREEDAFRADLDAANGMVSASIGSILEGDRRGQPKHDWTLVRADLPNARNTPILRPSSLRDFDEEMPVSDKAKLPDFVQDKRTYRAIVMEMLGRQYDYADERMLDIFIERAVGQSVRGGQSLVAFVEDTFTDTNGTLLQNHTPDTGGAWEPLDFTFTLSPTTDDAEIQSNQLVSASATNERSRAYRNAASPDSADYVLSAQLHTDGADSVQGVLAHYGRLSATGTTASAVDRYFFYMAYRDAASGSRLGKVISGSHTYLSSTNPVTEGVASDTTYDVVFDISDSLKEGTVTGVYSLSSTDNDITQVGRPAVVAPNPSNGAWVDNYKAEQEPSIEITSVTPSEFADSDTGITIAGSGFEASQGTGKVELGDDSDYATATLVEQTVTSWSDTSIDFTVDQGALSLGDVWAFVTNDSGSTTDPGTAATLINDGTIAATFPSLAGAASGTQTQEGTTAASLPSLSASASGVVAEFVGSIDVTLPSLSGSATGAQAQEGTVEATLPSLTGSATGNQPFTGDMAATLPSLAASISGTANFHDATVSAVLPSLTGSITAAQVFTGTITATLPSLTGHARHGLLSEYLPPGRAIKRVPPPGTVFFR